MGNDLLANPPDELNVAFTHEGFSCGTASLTSAGWGLGSVALIGTVLLCVPMAVQWGLLGLLLAGVFGSAGIYGALLRIEDEGRRYRRFRLDCIGTTVATIEAEKARLDLDLHTIEHLRRESGAILLAHGGRLTRIPEVGTLPEDQVAWLAEALSARIPKQLDPGSEEHRRHQARQNALRALMNRTSGE